MDKNAARLASFKASKSSGKKRTSTLKGKQAGKWPHQTPTPEQLARAGFFFEPTASAPDSVQCFSCMSVLDGWDPEDDPVREHLQFAPACPWAVQMGVERDVETGQQHADHPMSEKMLEARRATFGDEWPHEKKRGWSCKTQKMAEAGWYYCPNEESDDFVKCAYCGLGLDGWEPKDKPFDEHQRRSPDCYFFTVEKLSKTKATRGKKVAASKGARASNASATILSVDELTIQSINLDSSMVSNSTENPMPSAGSKAKKGAKAKKGRKVPAKKEKPQAEAALADSSLIEVPQEVSVVIPVQKDMPEPEVIPVPKTRGTKRPSDRVEDEPQEEEAPPPKRRATRTRSSTVKPLPPAPVQAVEESTDVHMVDSEEPKPAPKRGKGGRKRASSRSSRTRQASKLSTASKASLHATVPADDEIDAVLEADLDRPLTNNEDEPMEDVPLPHQPTPEPQVAERPKSNTTASVASTRRNTRISSLSGSPKQRLSRSSASTRFESAPSNRVSSTAASEAEPAPAPTPAAEPEPAPGIAHPSPAPPTPAKQQQQMPSPTPSPQSSDAENHPPSTRPSQTRPPLVPPSPQVLSPEISRTVRVPLAPSTPSRAPGLQGNKPKLQTSLPWTAVDVEYILAGTPAAEKENVLPGIDEHGKVLTSPEKGLTVEEWIQDNAAKRGEKLKAACERMVGVFESEGVRALKTIEGITCSD